MKNQYSAILLRTLEIGAKQGILSPAYQVAVLKCYIFTHT